MPDWDKLGKMRPPSGHDVDGLIWVPDDIHSKYPDGFVVRVEVKFMMLRHGDRLLVSPSSQHRKIGTIVVIYRSANHAPELSMLTDETLADDEFIKLLMDSHIIATAFGFSRNGVWHSLRAKAVERNATLH
jgi:hypothetical protein